MVTSPTRGLNIMDLIFTSYTTFIDKTLVLPGLSDYDTAIAEVNARPAKPKQIPRNIPH